MKEIEVLSDSGMLSATLFEGSKTDTVLVIASATGVKQEFYQKFAQFIAGNGIAVLTFDYLGIGRSLRKPIRTLRNNTADWGKNDLESVLEYVASNYPNSNKIILGHSIGGQLIGLAKSSPKLDKLILVAAQSGYWKYWNGMGRIKMWLNWYILFPILLLTFGYLKSKKISGMENLPKNVARQWSNWGKHRNYILSDPSIGQTYYDKIGAEITAFSIDDDNFAPAQAVEWMTKQYTAGSKKKRIHLKPLDFEVKKIGHFGVFKEQFQKTIWADILNEIGNCNK